MWLTDCARIPRPIMTNLVQDKLVGTVGGIRLISTDGVKEICRMYDE